MIHFHRWSKWEDVGEDAETRSVPMVAGILLIRQRIRQKRRCSVCDLLETRTA